MNWVHCRLYIYFLELQMGLLLHGDYWLLMWKGLHFDLIHEVIRSAALSGTKISWTFLTVHTLAFFFALLDFHLVLHKPSKSLKWWMSIMVDVNNNVLNISIIYMPLKWGCIRTRASACCTLVILSESLCLVCFWNMSNHSWNMISNHWFFETRLLTTDYYFLNPGIANQINSLMDVNKKIGISYCKSNQTGL
jgi:hypothetical protein